MRYNVKRRKAKCMPEINAIWTAFLGLALPLHHDDAS
jgi:hypothetical protein